MTTRRNLIMQAVAVLAIGIAGPLSLGQAEAKAGNGRGGGGKGGGGKGGGAGGKGGGAAKGKGKPAKASTVSHGLPNVTVLHRNGMRETVRNDRYEMRDARNRPIVNRRATVRDIQRIRRAR
jgi:hypothetical protein